MDTLRHYTRKMIDDVVKTGKRGKFASGFIVAKVVTSSSLGKELYAKIRHPFVISVTKKVDTRSVYRNKIRRQLKPFIMSLEPDLQKKGLFCLIVIREPLEQARTNIDTVKNDIAAFLRSLA